MRSDQALKLVCQYQKKGVYVVKTAIEKANLIKALQYLFEENADCYVRKIECLQED